MVMVVSVAIAAAAKSFTDQFAAYREIGAVLETSASALFLFAIATANLIVLGGVFRVFLRARQGEEVRDEDIDALLQQRG
jgi:high-affinity nickel-transport protein